MEDFKVTDISPSFTAEWQHEILSWYDKHRRQLPWRGTADPYKIWVSEIILQQTRVAQGLDYYKRFLQAFPSVDDLARASEDSVMQVWQGLGYYSRARNMQSAARSIVDMGGFPRDYAGVRSLKGVGDYTAAAICSFAYGMPHAVVDGNAFRLLSRYFGISIPIDTTRGKREFTALAQALLPTKLSADYNQAIMDFGATQCIPLSPHCDECPLSGGCSALAGRSVDQLPVKSHRTAVKNRYFVYFIIDTPDGTWLHRRRDGDIWTGLYEFPMTEYGTPTDIETILHSPFIESLPNDFTLGVVATKVKHVLTHRCIMADCYKLSFMKGIPVPAECVVVAHSDFGNYAVPRLVEKLWLLALNS